MPPRKGNRGRIPMGAPMPGISGFPAMFPQQWMGAGPDMGPPDIGMPLMAPHWTPGGGLSEEDAFRGPMAPPQDPYEAMIAQAMGQSQAAMGRRNLFLPESGYFGAHPRVSRGIENALLFAGGFQGGDTIGENIGGVARGLMGIEPQRQQIQMQRAMAPFAGIKPIMDIREMQSQMDYRASQSDLNRAQAERARSADDVALLRAQSTRPQRDDEGTWVFDVQKGWQFSPYSEAQLRKRRMATGNMIERQIAMEEEESGRSYTAAERAKRIGALGAMVGYNSAFGGASGRVGAGDIPERTTAPQGIRLRQLQDQRKEAIGFYEGLPTNVWPQEVINAVQDIDEEIGAMTTNQWQPGWIPTRKTQQPGAKGSKVKDLLRSLGVE